MSDDNPYAAGFGDGRPEHSRASRYEPVPLEVGAVLARAWELFTHHFGLLIVAMLLTAAPNLLLQVVNTVMQLAAEEAGNPDILPVVALISLGNSVVAMLIGTFLQLGLIRILIGITRGQEPRLGMLVGEGSSLLSAIGAWLLLMLVVLAGSILCVIPGIIAGVGLQFALYLVVDRGAGPVDALTDSWRLTNGSKWMLFLINLVVMLLAVVLGVVTCLLGLLLFAPLFTLVQAVMYHSLLHRHPEMAPESV